MDSLERRGCLGIVLELLGITPKPAAATLPYKRKEWLLSKAERSFFGVLQGVLASEQLIFVKVRLADLIYIPRGTPSRQAAFNRIQSKHIDFVLCEKSSVRPLLAIELDDSSHARSDRSARDRFVDSALDVAGLPLLVSRS